MKKKIAIIGAGPSGLFVFKALLETSDPTISITIFEAASMLGAGMPYSRQGACEEHLTNVSANEIPNLVNSFSSWISQLSEEKLRAFDFDKETFHEFKVFPRLLLGQYLSDQFELLLSQAKNRNIDYRVLLNTRVRDVSVKTDRDLISIETENEETQFFDQAVICTGHYWPETLEGKVKGYYDSPYPPQKLRKVFNHPVAIRGSSLTAVDAIRTLARQHGVFERLQSSKLIFIPNPDVPQFRIVLHSRMGLLPALRFNLENTHLQKDSFFSDADIELIKKNNSGFLPLDLVFEKDFKLPLIKKNPELYQDLENMKMEEFVNKIMTNRERTSPFVLLRQEYIEAEKSIQENKTIYWKELLAELSFSINYQAKHFSAEDMIRLHKTLLPLISVIIAFLPQICCEEILALHEAGAIELIVVGKEGRIEPHADEGILFHFLDEKNEELRITYQTFIDCIGQKHFSIEEFPFKSLIRTEAIQPASIRFKSRRVAKSIKQYWGDKIQTNANNELFIKLPGIKINDSFAVIDNEGRSNHRLYIMAVPFIGGFNPDYSGLDFCERASTLIVKDLMAPT